MKLDRNGKASIITPNEYSIIRRAMNNESYKILFDICFFTGERIGAVSSLKNETIYSSINTPRNEILFRADTRKSTPTGVKKTREVPMNKTLYEILKSWNPPANSIWLFPSRLNPQKHITVRSADHALRNALKKANLSHRGISCHSYRRSFITSLSEKGVPIQVIKKITGHCNLQVLTDYIEINDSILKAAINLI